jgi:hypothetical protein
VAAFLFLWAASARNRARVQLRRLRQPRYLLGTAAACAYLYWLVVRRLVDGPAQPLPARALAVVELALVLMGLASLASAWVVGKDRPLVSFSEAEVQLLLPAPLTRRQLLHAKLARFLLRGGAGALLSTLLLGRAVGGDALRFALGSWLGLSLLGLHATAASLTRAALAQRGASRLWRRALPLAGVGLYAALLVYGAWEAGLPPLAGAAGGRRGAGEAVARWAGGVLGSGLFALLAAPVRLPVHLALSRDAATLLWALPLTLGLLALHYRWVLAVDVAFEEAALEGAEARAREGRAGARDWRAGLERPRAAPPFRLSPRGRPEWALAWKNLTAGRRQRTGRLLGGAAAVAVAGGALVLSAAPPGGRLAGLGAVCGGLVAFLALLGPGALRLDLRLDLPHLAHLRALPLTGRQVVLGELAAPALTLALAQWALLLLGFLLLLTLPGGLSLPERLALLGAAALAAPAVTLAGLWVHNAGVLLLPGWVEPEAEQMRGLEAMGQRLLTLAGSLAVLLLGVLPAAGVAAAVGWPLAGVLGRAAGGLLGVAAGGAVLLGEVWLGVAWLGRLFDRTEPGQGA